MPRPSPPPVARLAAAALALLAVTPALVTAQPIVVQGLECRGDDASWRIDASTVSAHYVASAPRKRDVVFRGGLQALPGSPAIIVWRGDTTHLPRETVVLAAREEACRLALPGLPAGTHRALLSIRPGEAATGCCAVRAGYDARVAPIANLAAKPAGDWVRELPDLLPALNACAGRMGTRFKAVTFAQAQGTAVRVRMRDNEGKTVECTVDAAGRGTPTITAAEAVPGATGPWWYPAREPAPIVACGRLERAQNARGALIGYLQYDPC